MGFSLNVSAMLVRIAAVLISLLCLAAPARAQEADLIERTARYYLAYRADVAALAADKLDQPGDIERALERIGRHNRDDLSRGWIAYGALRVSASPAYKAGIESVVTRYGRGAVLNALAKDAAYPSRRRGYGEAIGFALDAASAERGFVISSSRAFDATSTRTLVWTATLSGETRSAQLRALAAARFAPTAAALSVAPPRAPTLKLDPGYNASARRMASLAGMRLLNARGDWNTQIDRMLNDPPTRDCVNAQKLQFQQCVSVTRDANEAASCLSEHGLRGMGGCFGQIVR